MPIAYLQPEHHLARYVPWARLRRDGDDNVIGVLSAAFRLRESEDYLSATWLEYFSGDKTACIMAAVKAVRNSSIEVKTKSGFAIGGVGRIQAACMLNKRKIRFVHEAEEDNPAHTALRNWPRDDELLLELLAEDAWSETILNKDVP